MTINTQRVETSQELWLLPGGILRAECSAIISLSRYLEDDADEFDARGDANAALARAFEFSSPECSTITSSDPSFEDGAGECCARDYANAVLAQAFELNQRRAQASSRLVRARLRLVRAQAGRRKRVAIRRSRAGGGKAESSSGDGGDGPPRPGPFKSPNSAAAPLSRSGARR